MLPDATLPVPASLMGLLTSFAPLFTAPSFRTFTGLACGFLAQAGRRTVCGMLAGAGLSRWWPHDRAHRFFARARWNPNDLGLAAAELVVALLVPSGQPVTVAIDDTLFRRRGTASTVVRAHGGFGTYHRRPISVVRVTGPMGAFYSGAGGPGVLLPGISQADGPALVSQLTHIALRSAELPGPGGPAVNLVDCAEDHRRGALDGPAHRVGP
jgi:DDE superfamily endonuclease